MFLLEIREWLKSLRLHKYTKMLLEISYEELLQLSDETLEKKNVTMGARGKILKYISHIRDRPNTLKQCARDLTVSQSKKNEEELKFFTYFIEIKLCFFIDISFISSNAQFYESLIFCWFWAFFLDKSFKLISKYTQKCQYSLLY